MDGTEMTEGSSALNPYLFLAKHGMAVAGAGAGASTSGKSRRQTPATTADINGANTGNAASAVEDTEENKRSAAFVE